MTKTLSRLLVGAALLGLPAGAQAAQYEIFIDVDNEDELYDLQVAQEISSGTFETLVDLMRRGIDLNTASRETLYALPNLTYDDVDAIIAYRTEAGRIGDPAALVLAGALSRRKLEAIAAFLVVPAEEGSKVGVRGFVKYRTIWTSEDNRVPPMALQARVSTLRHLTVGAAAVLDRNRFDDVEWDPNREALSSNGARITPRLPKYFVQWDTPKWGLIAGTYNIGFGQRLVFDTTGRYTPNGFVLDDTLIRTTELSTDCRNSTGELAETPCPRSSPNRYVTPDFREQVRLRGVAVGAKHVSLPVGWLQSYAFFSHQTKPVYQFSIYNRDNCDDPRLDGDLFPECKAPSVYQSGSSDPLNPAPAHLYATLPNMYNEVLGGGNVSYFVNRRTHVGVTGYGSDIQWLVDGADLDFQEWNRTPGGGPFGAAGADMSWGRKWADVFAEVAYAFDSASYGPGGGPGALVRSTATWGEHELEASGRYYGEGFKNPYARSISSPDQRDGLRAIDEAGARLKYTGLIAGRADVRGTLNIWQEPSTGTNRLLAASRADVRTVDWLTPGLWVDYQTRDLSERGRGGCFSGDEDDSRESSGEIGNVNYEDIILGNTPGCQGDRFRITPRVQFDPHKRASIRLQFQYAWVDDGVYDDRFSNDVRLVGIVNANPIDPLRLRLRLTWDKDDISDDARLEESFWAYLQASYRFQTWLQPSLRYDVRAWLDDRQTTPLRRPNPEHWVMLQIMSRF